MEPKKQNEFSMKIHWVQPAWDNITDNDIARITRITKAIQNLQSMLSSDDYLSDDDDIEEINEQEMDTFFDMIHYDIVDSKVKGDVHPEIHDLIMNAYHKYKA